MGANRPALAARSVPNPRTYLRPRGNRRAWLLGNGLQFFITPKSAWKAYGADGKGVSKEAVAWTRLVGWSIVLRGIYMGSLILGSSRQDAMGYTFIGAALNALRLSISGDAETIGVSKKGQVFFVAFPLLVAAASFATLEPSELLSP